MGMTPPRHHHISAVPRKHQRLALVRTLTLDPNTATDGGMQGHYRPKKIPILGVNVVGLMLCSRAIAHPCVNKTHFQSPEGLAKIQDAQHLHASARAPINGPA
jgi:hypothetical protein